MKNSRATLNHASSRQNIPSALTINKRGSGHEGRDDPYLDEPPCSSRTQDAFARKVSLDLFDEAEAYLNMD